MQNAKHQLAAVEEKMRLLEISGSKSKRTSRQLSKLRDERASLMQLIVGAARLRALEANINTSLEQVDED